MKKSNLLFEGSSWNEDTVDRIWAAARKLANEKYGLTFYEPRFEIVSYEQMLDNYSTVGMPNMYDHWSFGKERIKSGDKYKKGEMGLAYEMVLNTNPSICYLMEDNTALMQCLVILHASIGHSAFFKNNHYFKIHTNADTVVEDLAEAKSYIQHCEETCGEANVAHWLSIAQSLHMWGYDVEPRCKIKTEADRLLRRQELISNYNRSSNELADLIPFNHLKDREKLQIELNRTVETIQLPEQNLLRFISEHSSSFPTEAKNIFKIVADINQYFYPQMTTKLMNEGFATFWHYTLLNDFYDMGYIHEGHMIEFLASHSGVTHQPTHDKEYYSGINVYALGFDMFQKLRKVCENPSDKDRRDFPLYADTEWTKTVQDVAYNFRDETFVYQCLHEDTSKKFELFAIEYRNEDNEVLVKGIQNNEDFKEVRKILARSYNIDYNITDIEIISVDRSFTGEMVRVNLNLYTESDGVGFKHTYNDFVEYLEALLGCSVSVAKHTRS